MCPGRQVLRMQWVNTPAAACLQLLLDQGEAYEA